MSVFWIPVISVIGGIGLVIVLVVMGAATRQKQAQLKADVQMKLIERFGTASEFVNFVQSPEGKQFLGDGSTAARRGVASGVRSGIILGFIGLAFTFVAFVEHDRGWFIPGFILLGLGAGFFLSAMISMKLARDMERPPAP